MISRRLRSFLVAAALAGALAGCAGRAEGVLAPVQVSAPGTSRVEMLVATTRQQVADPAFLFNGERGPGLQLADITVSIPPDANRTIGEVQWPSRLPGNPATDFVTVSADTIDRATAETRLRGLAGSHGGRVLVFVHGYNNKFEDAVYRFAQFSHDSKAPAAPVLFTWPSRGRLLAYGYDRESANYSRDALEEMLRALDRNKAVTDITLLAHSMGNWVTLEALRQMAIRDGKMVPKLTTVILAAPDVDIDVFRTQYAQIQTAKGKRPQMTLFVSRDDMALAASRRLMGSTARLGAIDPDAEPFKSQLASDHISVIDLTKLRAGDATHHSKFTESPEVVQFIGQRLVAGQTIDGHAPSLGDRIGLAATGVAGTIGATAGLVVTAPIAVVDPATRKGLGDRIEEVNHQAGSVVGSTQ